MFDLDTEESMKKVFEKIRAAAPTGAVLAGCAAIAGGVAMLSIAAGIITAGVALVALGILMTKGENDAK